MCEVSIGYRCLIIIYLRWITWTEQPAVEARIRSIYFHQENTPLFWHFSKYLRFPIYSRFKNTSEILGKSKLWLKTIVTRCPVRWQKLGSCLEWVVNPSFLSGVFKSDHRLSCKDRRCKAVYVPPNYFKFQYQKNTKSGVHLITT